MILKPVNGKIVVKENEKSVVDLKNMISRMEDCLSKHIS